MAKEDTSHHVTASYMWDRQEPLVMGIYEQPANAFHILFIHLSGHLTRSVLNIHDLNRGDGNFQPTIDLVPYQDALFNQL